MRTKLTAALGALTGFTLIALSSLALSPTLASANTTDDMMGRLAAKQTMGWKDNRVPLHILERRVANGQRIFVSCSIIAELGIRLANRYGIATRRVSAITNARFDGYNDGHAMFEVKLGGRWVLYDLDLNRVAVDKHGRRVGLNHQVKAGENRRWRVLARDRDRWDFRGMTAVGRRMLLPKSRMSVDRWYQRAFGVALVETKPGEYVYHGSGRRSPRIESASPMYRWVNAATWRRINR